MNAQKGSSQPTRKGANLSTNKATSLAELSTGKLAKLLCFSDSRKPLQIDCAAMPNEIADERAARVDWFDAVILAIIINAVVVAAFGNKIAAALAQ